MKIYQEFIFLADGTYTFNWYFMSEDPIHVEKGTYSITDGVLTTVVTETVVDSQQVSNISQFTTALSTNADGLQEFTLGDNKVIEVKAEA